MYYSSINSLYGSIFLILLDIKTTETNDTIIINKTLKIIKSIGINKWLCIIPNDCIPIVKNEGIIK